MTKLLNAWTFGFLALLCRVPFLNKGYGKEFDAWSNALNAKIISETGNYEVSRLPGHPLQEYLLSALWPIEHSPWFFNLLAAIFSAIAVGVFYDILKIHQIKSAVSWTMAFNFIPVFFIAGTYTIDYNFALAFILLAYRALLRGSYLWIGIYLGLATGFRISSVALLLPFLLLIGWRNWRAWLLMSLVAGAVSLLCFSLPLYTYGMGFLDFHKPPFPGWSSVLYKLGLGIWGLPFLIFLVASAWQIFKESRTQLSLVHLQGISFRWFLMLLIALQLFVFIRLPFKAEFFIPAVPFILILWADSLSERWAYWSAYLSLASLLVLGFDYDNPWRGAPVQEPAFRFAAGGQTIYCSLLKGPLQIDQGKRAVRSKTVERTISRLDELAPSLVTAGWYWPELVLKYPEGPHFIDHYSTKEEVDSARAAGLQILYLPEIGQQNAIIHGHNLLLETGQAILEP